MGKKRPQYQQIKDSNDSVSSDTTLVDSDRDIYNNKNNLVFGKDINISGGLNNTNYDVTKMKRDNNYTYGSINESVVNIDKSSGIELSGHLDVNAKLEDVSSTGSVCKVKLASWFTHSFVTVAYVVLIGDTTRGCLFPTLWPLVSSLGGDKVVQGYIVSGFSSGRLLASPICGKLSDSYGYRTILIITSILLGIGSLCYISSFNLYTLFFSQVLMGIGSGTLGVTRAYVNKHIASKSNNTILLAYLTAVQYAGFTVMPFMGSFVEYLFENVDYRYGPFHITMYTAPALFITCLCILSVILLMFNFSDYVDHSTQKNKGNYNERQSLLRDTENEKINKLQDSQNTNINYSSYALPISSPNSGSSTLVSSSLKKETQDKESGEKKLDGKINNREDLKSLQSFDDMRSREYESNLGSSVTSHHNLSIYYGPSNLQLPNVYTNNPDSSSSNSNENKKQVKKDKPKISSTVEELAILGLILLNVSTKGSIAIYETLGLEYAMNHVSLSAVDAGFFFSSCGLIGVIALLNMRFFCKYFNDLQLIVGGMILMTLCNIILLFDDRPGTHHVGKWKFLVAIFFMYASGYPVGHTAVIGLFGKVLKEREQGALMGWFASSGSLARVIFPIFGGYISNYFGFHALFFIDIIILIVSIVILVSTRKVLIEIVSFQ